MRMDAKARSALATIRRCCDAGRYRILPHFTKRMDDCGLFWPDVLAVLDDPRAVKASGRDRFHRPKWIIVGTAMDGLPIDLVCALDVDENGDVTVFITAY